MRKRKRIVFDLDGTLFDPYVENRVYGDAHSAIIELSFMADLSLVTAGDSTLQQSKLNNSGLNSFFEPIKIVPEKMAKLEALRLFFPGAGIVDGLLQPSDVIVVGDRIEFEIAFGRRLGYTTVRILRGPHCSRRPANVFEKADLEISELNELVSLVKNDHE